jgi:hypothetical protein
LSVEYALKNGETFLLIIVLKNCHLQKELLGEKTGTLVKVNLVTGIANA